MAFGCQVLASCMGTPKMALQLLHNGMAKQIVAGLEKHGSKVSCGDVCWGAYAFNILHANVQLNGPELLFTLFDVLFFYDSF